MLQGWGYEGKNVSINKKPPIVMMMYNQYENSI